MYETLMEYRARTLFMKSSLPENADFQTNMKLGDKVDWNGRFKPFYGDTVVFDLPESVKDWIEKLQHKLYSLCGYCLAEKIPAETFHITLHDLHNSPENMPAEVDEDRKKVRDILMELDKKYPEEISLRSVCLFNMVNTSIVLGFEPAREEDCAALMRLYEELQHVVPLAYPLTLHVTLAYFKPGIYNHDMLRALRSLFDESRNMPFEMKLRMKDLFYALFTSMIDYCLVSDIGDDGAIH